MHKVLMVEKTINLQYSNLSKCPKTFCKCCINKHKHCPAEMYAAIPFN